MLNFFKQKKIGLALSGGGTKGFAYIGAQKAFEELGLKFDAICGTSTGSLFGAFMAHGYSSAEMQKIANSLDKKDIKLNVIPFAPSKTDGIQKIITANIGDININQLKTPFCAVAVNMKNGEEVHFRNGNLAKCVAGSCAVPIIFSPVEYDGKVLADGGLLNNIPSNAARLMGCDYVVAIDLSSNRGNGTDSLKLFDQAVSAISIMIKSNSIKGKVSADILLSPNLKRFKSSKLEGTEQMIEEGYKSVYAQKNELLYLFKKAKKITNKEYKQRIK